MLSFAIPTWNRADKLDTLLANLTFEITKLNRQDIKVFIHDNANTDDTPQVIEKWRRLYPGVIRSIRSDDHVDGEHSFARAFTGTETEWTWCMGDDDVLVEDALPIVLSLLAGGKYDFLHVAERSRCAGTNGVYTNTFEQMCQSVGLVDFCGFISGNIARSSLLKQAFSSENVERFHKAWSFYQCVCLYSAFHDRPAALCDFVCIDNQDKDQTADTIARWVENQTLPKYSCLVEGLDELVADGILSKPVHYAFLRYQNGDMIGKILGYIGHATMNGQDVPDYVIPNLRRLADYFEPTIAAKKHAFIDKFTRLTDMAADISKRRAECATSLDAAYGEEYAETYPFTYLNTN